MKGREPTWSNALTRALNEACTVEEWQGLGIADRQDEAIYLGSVAATEEERAAALGRIQNRSQHGIGAFLPSALFRSFRAFIC